MKTHIFSAIEERLCNLHITKHPIFEQKEGKKSNLTITLDKLRTIQPIFAVQDETKRKKIARLAQMNSNNKSSKNSKI